MSMRITKPLIMKVFLPLLFAVCLSLSAYAQPDPSFCPCYADTFRTHSLRVCFYNLENFFYPERDSTKNDMDFTPSGANHWTYYRYYTKANHMAKVMLAMGGWDPPEVIGLAEVENEQVLKTLIHQTPLKAYAYRYVHFDSPDPRGIDVALLYRPERFQVLHSEAVPVRFIHQSNTHTRDILYVKGIANGADDTLHLFVNHFTSRYGGYKATISKRTFIASLLRSRMEAIRQQQPQACVLAMGDFNDSPTDSSMRYYLHAVLDTAEAGEGTWMNLMYPYVGKNGVGTHKYQRMWSVLDQFVVAPSMLQEQASYHVAGPVCIFAMPFMLVEDEKYLGKKPYRTFVGRKYQGGFSDHLPIMLDLKF